jgi:hypothetical protein
VLVDPELRDGIKKFSNWPTIPQVGDDDESLQQPGVAGTCTLQQNVILFANNLHGMLLTC